MDSFHNYQQQATSQQPNQNSSTLNFPPANQSQQQPNFGYSQPVAQQQPPFQSNIYQGNGQPNQQPNNFDQQQYQANQQTAQSQMPQFTNQQYLTNLQAQSTFQQQYQPQVNNFGNFQNTNFQGYHQNNFGAGSRLPNQPQTTLGQNFAPVQSQMNFIPQQQNDQLRDQQIIFDQNLQNPLLAKQKSIVEVIKIQNEPQQQNQPLQPIPKQADQYQMTQETPQISPEIEKHNENQIHKYYELRNQKDVQMEDDENFIRIKFTEINVFFKASQILDLPYGKVVQPFNIQPCKKIDALAEVYKSELYKTAVHQAKDPKIGISHYRGVRGDGNCFYRSVSYGYVERLVMTRNINAIKDLITWIHCKGEIYNLENDFYEQILKSNLSELKKIIEQTEQSKQGQQKLYNIVQKLFFNSPDFDKAFIFMIRTITKNFLYKYQERSINELPISVSVMTDAESLDDYIQNIVMRMETDAQGPLLNILPIVLRINIYIVNLDTSMKARQNLHLPKFNIEESKSYYKDIKFIANDHLNLHDEYLYVLRKDGHYDLLYQKDNIKFENIDEFQENDQEFLSFFRERIIEQIEVGFQPNLINDPFKNDQSSLIQNMNGKINMNSRIDSRGMIKLQCCGKMFEQVPLAFMLQPDEGQDYFYLEGKLQPPACPDCGKRLSRDDILAILPDKEQEINKLFIHYQQSLTSGNIKPEPPKIIKPNPQPQKSKCPVIGCKKELQSNDTEYLIKDCKDVAHLQCLFEYISTKTNNKFLISKKKDQRFQNGFNQGKVNKYTVVCPNANCNNFPPYTLTQNDCKDVYVQLNGAQAYEELVVFINAKKITMPCCKLKMIKLNFFEVMHLKKYKMDPHSSKEFYQIYDLDQKNNIIAPKCPGCSQYFERDQFLQDAFSTDLKEIQQQIKSLELIARTEFECFECIMNKTIDPLLRNMEQEYIQTFLDQCKVRYVLAKAVIERPQINEFLVQYSCYHGKQITVPIFRKIYYYYSQKEIENCREIRSFLQNFNELRNYKNLSEKCKQNISCICGKQFNKQFDFCSQQCLICSDCNIKLDCISCNSFLNTECSQCFVLLRYNSFNIFKQEIKSHHNLCEECFLHQIDNIPNDESFFYEFGKLINCKAQCSQFCKNKEDQCQDSHFADYQKLYQYLKKQENDYNFNKLNAILSKKLSLLYKSIQQLTCKVHASGSQIIGFKSDNTKTACYPCYMKLFEEQLVEKQKKALNIHMQREDKELDMTIVETKKDQANQKLEVTKNEKKFCFECSQANTGTTQYDKAFWLLQCLQQNKHVSLSISYTKQTIEVSGIASELINCPCSKGSLTLGSVKSIIYQIFDLYFKKFALNIKTFELAAFSSIFLTQGLSDFLFIECFNCRNKFQDQTQFIIDKTQIICQQCAQQTKQFDLEDKMEFSQHEEGTHQISNKEFKMNQFNNVPVQQKRELQENNYLSQQRIQKQIEIKQKLRVSYKQGKLIYNKCEIEKLLEQNKFNKEYVMSEEHLKQCFEDFAFGNKIPLDVIEEDFEIKVGIKYFCSSCASIDNELVSIYQDNFCKNLCLICQRCKQSKCLNCPQENQNQYRQLAKTIFEVNSIEELKDTILDLLKSKDKYVFFYKSMGKYQQKPLQISFNNKCAEVNEWIEHFELATQLAALQNDMKDLVEKIRRHLNQYDDHAICKQCKQGFKNEQDICKAMPLCEEHETLICRECKLSEIKQMIKTKCYVCKQADNLKASQVFYVLEDIKEVPTMIEQLYPDSFGKDIKFIYKENTLIVRGPQLMIRDQTFSIEEVIEDQQILQNLQKDKTVVYQLHSQDIKNKNHEKTLKFLTCPQCCRYNQILKTFHLCKCTLYCFNCIEFRTSTKKQCNFCSLQMQNHPNQVQDSPSLEVQQKIIQNNLLKDKQEQQAQAQKSQSLSTWEISRFTRLIDYNYFPTNFKEDEQLDRLLNYFQLIFAQGQVKKLALKIRFKDQVRFYGDNFSRTLVQWLAEEKILQTLKDTEKNCIYSNMKKAEQIICISSNSLDFTNLNNYQKKLLACAVCEQKQEEMQQCPFKCILCSSCSKTIKNFVWPCCNQSQNLAEEVKHQSQTNIVEIGQKEKINFEYVASIPQSHQINQKEHNNQQCPVCKQKNKFLFNSNGNLVCGGQSCSYKACPHCLKQKENNAPMCKNLKCGKSSKYI